MEYLIEYVALFLVILIAMPIHEFAHAFAAVKAGDPTPRLNGRYTLNPLKHFDPLGLVMLLVARFGWAKPVPVNPYNFRHLKRDYLLVSIAGITANIILAFIFGFFYVLTVFLCGVIPPVTQAMEYLAAFFMRFFLYGVIVDLNLCIFNLIPVYPLDGFRVLDCLLKRKGKVFAFLRKYGYFALLALILWGIVCDFVPFLQPFDIFGYIISVPTSFIANRVIIAFWRLIFPW